MYNTKKGRQTNDFYDFDKNLMCILMLHRHMCLHALKMASQNGTEQAINKFKILLSEI